jgi:hypothetical protein
MKNEKYTHCSTWIMARKLTNEENEILTGSTEYMARNTEKPGK